jgi:hypothetical protein
MSLSSGSSTCSSSDLIQTLSSIDGNERRRRSKRKSKVLQTESEEIVRKCLWHKCSYETKDATQIIEHIKSKHIFTQKSLKTFKCLWKGCRVYKAQSCSFNWLERHSITHVDNKPFACIINDCSRKFQTQASLERHVNSHMNVYESSSSPTKNTSVNNLSASLSTSNLQSTSLLACSNNNGLNRNNSKLPKKRRVVENGNCRNFRKGLACSKTLVYFHLNNTKKKHIDLGYGIAFIDLRSGYLKKHAVRALTAHPKKTRIHGYVF